MDSSDFDRRLDLLSNLEDLISKIPYTDGLKNEINLLKELLLKKRAPRLAVIGRRGAGKSSLFNAIVDKQQLAVGDVDTTVTSEWNSIELPAGGAVDWLDTPGLGAAELKEVRLEGLKRCIQEKRPDVIVFAHKADEVDGEIDSTLDELKAVIDLTEFEGKTTHLYVAITQVDKLNPSWDIKPPYKESKLQSIDMIVDKMRQHLARKGIVAEGVMPIATFFDEEHDGRWNIDKFSSLIEKKLPLQAKVEAARAFKQADGLRRNVAEKITNTCAVIASGIATVPIPLSDIIPLTALQVTMVTGIGYIGGQKLDVSAAKKFITGLGGVLVVGTTLRQLSKLFPGSGSVISATIAAAGTKAIGAAAIAHFLDKKTLDEVKVNFENMQKAHL